MNIYLQKADGTTKELPERRPTLEEAQKLVKGYVEICYGRRDGLQVQIICNEEGLMRKLPLNREASYIRGGPIVGDAILITGGKRLWMR